MLIFPRGYTNEDMSRGGYIMFKPEFDLPGGRGQGKTIIIITI